MRCHGPLVLGALLAGLGCVGADNELQRLEAFAFRHAEELEAFNNEKALFAKSNALPQRLELPGAGTLYVRACELMGWPGKAYLYVEFTYVNTTGRRLGEPRVFLTILDPATGDESTGWLDLVMPFALDLTPDSSYSSWLEVDTDGIHLRSGWEWRMDVDTREDQSAQATASTGSR